MFHLSLFATVLFIGSFNSVLNLPRQNDPIENPGHSRRLFQGDIYLRTGTLSKDRFATKHEWLRWPNAVVPYTLDQIYSESEKQLIRSAMDEFEKQTCIKWIEKTDEDNYVEIYSEMGCYSDLGRIGGVQYLSLESPDCMEKGVIMHEMMHALGFLHEQSRFDRDEYVQVTSSIVPRKVNQGRHRASTTAQDYHLALSAWQVDNGFSACSRPCYCVWKNNFQANALQQSA
ncbi:zinc metalloproteinase nas-15 [Trichonephila clavipes]|nr:zinc metalloproteinase nas-15 [Trichonephila clavipes]